METRRIPCPWGPFHVVASPWKRTVCSELTCLHVFLGEYEYDRPSVENVRSLLDIGCNVGAFTVWASRWWPGLAQVYAYDPNVAAVEFYYVNVRNCVDWVQTQVSVHPVAISVDDHPLFLEHDDWGGSRTHGETRGVHVPAIHPRDLPPVDALKCDAEGVDGDVFEHYAHWSGVKIAIGEYHCTADRERMMAKCKAEGLELRRHRPDSDTQGVAVWVRP